MWLERFEEMQVKVDAFLIGYKSDFEIDKKTIIKAPQDTFLWMLRKTGTQLVNLTEVEKGEYKITDTALYFFYRQGTLFCILVKGWSYGLYNTGLFIFVFAVYIRHVFFNTKALPQRFFIRNEFSLLLFWRTENAVFNVWSYPA